MSASTGRQKKITCPYFTAGFRRTKIRRRIRLSDLAWGSRSAVKSYWRHSTKRSAAPTEVDRQIETDRETGRERERETARQQAHCFKDPARTQTLVMGCVFDTSIRRQSTLYTSHN